MGVWDWITSATAAVKNITPDVTPAADTFRKSYDICRDSTAHVAGAATNKAREVQEYLSDDQVRDNLSRVAVNVSKNGALYIARSYGGGPIIDIVSRSLQDKMANNRRIDDLEAKVAKLEEELNSKRVAQQLEVQRLITAPMIKDESDLIATVNHRPEDVLEMFMMEQSVGTKLFYPLIIPTSVASKWKEKTVLGMDGKHE